MVRGRYLSDHSVNMPQISRGSSLYTPLSKSYHGYPMLLPQMLPDCVKHHQATQIWDLLGFKIKPSCLVSPEPVRRSLWYSQTNVNTTRLVHDVVSPLQIIWEQSVMGRLLLCYCFSRMCLARIWDFADRLRSFRGFPGRLITSGVATQHLGEISKKCVKPSNIT